MEERQSVLMRTIKTKRSDGHAMRTIYFMDESGLIGIHRQMVSTELNEGFVKIRNFGRLIYQEERILFKFESFVTIAKAVLESSVKLDLSKLISIDEVISKPNDKTRSLILPPKK